ncbi:MAG: RnfABCDGE type electron transport complex subunit G [Eubacterium sp.]
MSNKEKVTIDWKNVIRLALILFIITAVASTLLALTNFVTKDIIAERNDQANTVARQAVLQDADKFEQVDAIENLAKTALPTDYESIAEAYIGYKGDKIVGYTIKTTPSGYGGEVEILTGISINGKVTGITILNQNETPGLGAKSTDPVFQEQFKDKDAKKEITVVKGGTASDNQIVAITGATITSKAVATGVNYSEKVFEILTEKGAIK